MTEINTIRFYREKVGLTQTELAQKINMSLPTLWRWEKCVREPRISDLQKLSEVLGVTVDELLNGPGKNEIDVRIVIRETDEEVGNVTMDMSKDAPFLQLVEIGPHKTGLNLVFSPEKSLREVCEMLLASEEKIETARNAIYGTSA